MVPGQLAPQLVHESRLVRVECRHGDPQDQRRGVLGSVLRDCEQELGDHGSRVVVQAPEEAEVEEREPSILGEEDVAAVWVGVVDALARHLVYVRPEELPGEELCALRLEPVVGAELLAVNPLQDEHVLCHVRTDDCGHDQVVVLLDEPCDQLGVRRLLLEVELGAEVGLDLVRESLQLKEPRSVGALLGKTRGRAQQVEVLVDLLRGCPGRRTLTTTSRPSFRSAEWIWAIEAAASGSGSILANTFSPRAAWIAGSISENGTGGTSSVSFVSSSM